MEKFWNYHAKNSMWNDYLKPDVLLGKELSLMFKIAQSRFEKLKQDVIGKSIPFFSDISGRNWKSAASLEAHLLIPIKTLVYRGPTHTFLDCFQMSEVFGRMTCRDFYAGIKQCYTDEFPCLPTAMDKKLIVKLHKSQHNFDGVYGSLDCPQANWKICLMAWHGSLKG